MASPYHLGPGLACVAAERGGSDSVSSVTVFTGGKEKELDVNGVFSYVHDYQPAIEYLKGKISVLDGFGGLDARADWVLSCHDMDGNPYVIVNIRSVKTFEKVTKKLKAVEMIDPENPIVLMDQ